MTLSIIDGITPTLTKLKERSGGLFNQALHFGGMAVREKIIKSTRNYSGRSEFNQEFINGRRRITVGDKSKPHYQRLSKRNNNILTADIGQFTRAKLFPEKHVIVIGYMDTKRFTKYKFRDGIQSANGTSRGTFITHIAKPLMAGGRQRLSRKQKYLFKFSGLDGIAKRGYVDKRPHPSMRINKFAPIFEKEARITWDKTIGRF